ncbi:hypothetical protein OROGR_028675 [Orobanche gracilis]
MPPFSDKELEERLTAAGKSLLQPPSSLDELLPLLDQIEKLLSKVEQSPTQSMHTALSPLMKALVMEELLKHSDADVQVGIASCISEVTRITAPDAPYNDDKMKDIFQLIVSSFENLSDTSSRSYEKRATILETASKVRSCVIMLDLECDQMIIEMFQHFLKAVRGDHAEAIFASMETIMTLVLEESEDISPDLLNPILATLKMNNKAVTPIAKKLAERVIQNSADKLRPYLAQAVKLDASLDDYSEVVALVCQENSDTVKNSNESISRDQPVVERKSSSASPARDQVTQVAKNGREETNYQEKDLTLIGSSKLIVKNGTNGTSTEEIMSDANYSKKADFNHEFDAKSRSKSDSDDFAAQDPENLEAKTRYSEAQEVSYNHEMHGDDVPISPTEEEPVEAAESLGIVEETATQFSPQSPENEAANVASPTQSGSLCDDSGSKKESLRKRKENLAWEEIVSAATASKKAFERESISKAKKQRQPGKKQSVEAANKDKALTEEGASKIDEHSTSESEARSLEQMEKPGDASKRTEDGSSVTKEVGKKSRSVKSMSKKNSPTKTKDNLVREEIVSVDSASKKASKEEGISKEKQQRKLGKKRLDETSNNDKALTEEGASKNDEGSISHSEAKSLEQMEKRGDVSNKTEDGSLMTMEYGGSGCVKPPSKKGMTKMNKNLVREEIVFVDTASKRASEGETISKAKKRWQYGKKRSDDTTNKEKTMTGGQSKNDEGSTSDSEARSLDQTENLGDASNKTDDVSYISKEDDIKSGCVKPTSGKGILRSSAKEVCVEGTVTSPTPLKSMKDEDIQEETPIMSSKRKQTPGTEEASETILHNKNLVGLKVRVWWPQDRMFYEGVIASFDSSKKKHKVVYNDGDEEVLNLKRQKWELVGDNLVSDGVCNLLTLVGATIFIFCGLSLNFCQQDDDVEHSGHDTSSDVPMKKKGNTNSETSKNKRQRVNRSPKSKLKDIATKSGGKLKGDGKLESEAKDMNNSEPNRKSVDDSLKHGGKSQESSDGRSKDVSAKTPKQDSQKSAARSQGKTPPQSGKTLKATKTNSSPKLKKTDGKKEKTPADLAKSSAVKGKSVDTSVSRESETKSGKKRRR